MAKKNTTIQLYEVEWFRDSWYISRNGKMDWKNKFWCIEDAEKEIYKKRVKNDI